MAQRRSSLISSRKLALIVGLAALALLSLSFGRMLLARYELGQRAQAIRQEIGALREENARLQEELAYWQSDEGLEQLAREELGWARPGESAALVVGADAPPSPEPSRTTRPAESTPNWRRWWQLFFGN